MNNVKLHCSLNKPELKISENPHALYLLVDIETENFSNTKKNIPLNIAMVIDKSGSMYDDGKLDNVILALHHVVDVLKPEDVLFVIAFADSAVSINRTAKNENRQELKAAINNLDEIDIGYKTNLTAGLETALIEIKANFRKNGINKIFILTDGEVDNESECRRIIEREKNSGISFTTIGVGEEFNEEFLISVAKNSGSGSYYIENPADIPSIFTTELENLNSAIFKDCKLKIETGEGVQVKQLARSEPEIALFTENDTVKFDTLRPGVKQSVLVELVVFPKTKGKSVLAEVQLFSAGELLVQESVYIKITSDAVYTQPLSFAFTEALDKVNNFRIQTRALDKLKRGQPREAEKIFTQVLGKKIKNKEKTNTLLTQVIEQIQTTQKLDPVMTKRLTYSMKK